MPIFVPLGSPACLTAGWVCVRDECSFSTCGLENPAVPLLPLLPVLPNATFPGAGCPSWHRLGTLWGIGCLSGAVRRGTKQAFPCRGCSWMAQCAAQGWHPASCWYSSGNVHGFLGCPPMSRGCVAVWEPCSHALQAVPAPLRGDKNKNHGPVPCHVLPAQCVCHSSSPGAWRAEGTAGNHNGMQSGVSKKSFAAALPPLCCALCPLRHLCLSCVVSLREERDGVFRVVTALSPPDRSQGHGGPGERL